MRDQTERQELKQEWHFGLWPDSRDSNLAHVPSHDLTVKRGDRLLLSSINLSALHINLPNLVCYKADLLKADMHMHSPPFQPTPQRWFMVKRLNGTRL
jgi:hypothetical protein